MNLQTVVAMCGVILVCGCSGGESGSDVDEQIVASDGGSFSDVDEQVVASDGGSFGDVDEQTAGNDPVNKFSWDYESGQWPDFSGSASGIVGTGYELSDILPDFALFDQFGNRVSLYQFYGYVVVLNFVTGWCNACPKISEVYQTMWADERETGFLVIQLVFENDTLGEPDTEWLSVWAKNHGLNFPVLNGYHSSVWTGFGYSGVPFSVLLDKDMTIDSKYEGIGNLDSVLERAKTLIAN